jgi:nucleoside transporter
VSVDMKIYIPLSLVMFLEYAVWGAWAPVLAARLLGPLKMSGKQTGWIYATLPLACIFSPLVAGQLADKWLNTEWILAAAHLIGAGLLFVAAREERFPRLFIVMLLYSTCYAATLPLVNSVLFSHVADQETRANVLIWAPVAWALVGYSLTGWRMTRKTEGDGSDCLVYAAMLSAITAVCCLTLPVTPPAGKGGMPIVQALDMLKDSNFLVFLVVSLIVAGLMQFYFLGSARFMQDMGIRSKHVPASMGIAQAAQVIATFFALSYFLRDVGYKWTLIIGAGCWLLLYLVYIAGRPRWLVIVGQSLHGLAYLFFIIVGQLFAEYVGGEDIRSSMQALIFAATAGVGLFLGTQAAGVVMDYFSVDGKFQWRKVWLAPAVVMLAGMIALAVAFHDPPQEAPPAADSPSQAPL